MSSQEKILFSSGQFSMHNLSSLEHPYCLASWTVSQKKLTYFFLSTSHELRVTGVTSVEPSFRAEQLAFLYGERKRT